MSGAIFKRLYDHAKAGGTVIADADKGRSVKRHSEDDALLMSRADITASSKITRHMRAVQFEHRGDRFFAFFGFPPTDDLPNGLPEGLAEVPLTPGTFALAVTQTDISPRETPSKIRDVIEANFHGVPGYDGHDLEDVAALFPRVLLLKADVNYKYTDDIERVLGAMVAVSYRDGPIALSEETLKALATLFEQGSEFIPYQNVLQGVLSISWGNFFVELYRCFEQLYAVPRLIELTKDWQSDKPLGELAELLEKRLSWRPKEDEALCSVIAGGCQSKTVSALISALALTTEVPALPHEVVGRAIYKMRNGLVHFRGTTKMPQRTDERWDEIIGAMLTAVIDIYQKYGEVYHEYVSAPEPAPPPASFPDGDRQPLHD